MYHLARSLVFVCLIHALIVVPAGAQDAPPPQVPVGQRWELSSAGMRIEATVIANDIATPSGMVFLPDGRLLATDRSRGLLLLIDPASGARTPVEGLPEVNHTGDAGTLDVALHPRYVENGWLYVVYSVDLPGGSMAVIDRARLDGARLTDRIRIYEARPIIENTDHYGARLLFREGLLYVSIGDHNARDLAQYLGDPYGKILRLQDDGSPAPGNPFERREDTEPRIWSFGHRNPQGLAFDPVTGQLWEHEHGPRGGDEINIIHRGRNYGWPLVSFGGEYAGGPVGKGLSSRPGMEAPVRHFSPAIAPSGMVFYTGAAFPGWRNNLFIGGMGAHALLRFEVSRGRIESEERLLVEQRWRVRNVVQGPDGLLYLGVDGGMIVRLAPAK